MPAFSDAQQVYDTIGKFLSQLMSDPEIGPKFERSETSFHIHYEEPTADMVVDCTQMPPKVLCGDTGPSEIELSMLAEDGHKFWLGDLNLTMAMARGKVKAQGPVSKMMKLLPALRPAFPKYVEFLSAEGKQELLPRGG